MIYLDNAATTFPKPEAVYIEMDRVNRNLMLTLEEVLIAWRELEVS